jgi:uncharacterized protein (DUF1810 family)
MAAADTFQLQRFIDAQEAVFEVALAEIRAGRKQSHWIWFIFPQLSGLARSPTAQFYAIRSLHEARAYLAHPILAERYREATRALLEWTHRKSPVEILGDVDAMKVRSSLTLFEIATGDPLFTTAIESLFGAADQATIKLLNRG